MHAHFPSTHLTRVFAVLTFFFAWLVVGCGQERLKLIGPQSTVFCPPKLADRLKLHPVSVEKPIAWQRWGYDGFPADERIALAVAPNGEAYLAWLEAVGRDGTSAMLPDKGVHITPLDKTLARRGPDTVHATGLEVSGLVAHDDGFALLIKDANPGENIESEDDGNTVPFLVRYKGEKVFFSVPLAGSASKERPDVSTIYSPMVMGQLIWSGSTYGAYFTVKGGLGDPSMGLWRDLLVYRDPFGQPTTPWLPTRGCTNNGGIRLIRDNEKFNSAAATQANAPDMTGICVQQKPSEVKFTALENHEKVSVQEVGWAGYSGAKFGSLLKIPDGYLVFWLSLGATNDHKGHDIRMAKLSRDFKLVEGPKWLTRTPGIEEWNLHVIPYGADSFLMIYNEIEIRGESPNSNYAVYLGDFRGTHLRLLDADGKFISKEDEVVLGSPITENDGPVVFPNGDVGWAFVNPTPDYSKVIPKRVGSTLKEFSIARLEYCY